MVEFNFYCFSLFRLIEEYFPEYALASNSKHQQ